MVHKYALVNPSIIGTLDTTVEASNSAQAAKEIYNKISPFFKTAQPNLIYTIQKLKSSSAQIGGGSDKTYYNFKVKEIEKNGEVIYTISSYSGKYDIEKLNNSLSSLATRINGKMNLLDSEEPPEPKKEMKGGVKKTSKSSKKSWRDEDDELDDDLNDIFPRQKNQYLSSFVIPNLVDPISYWWYNNIYYDASRLYIPSFIGAIDPYIIIDNPYLPWWHPLNRSSGSSSSKQRTGSTDVSVTYGS